MLKFEDEIFPKQYMDKAEKLINQIGHLSDQLLDITSEFGTQDLKLFTNSTFIQIRQLTDEEKKAHDKYNES